MKELIKAIRILQRQFNDKGYAIKNCEGEKFFGSIHLNINDGKIIFTQNSDNKGVTESIKI